MSFAVSTFTQFRDFSLRPFLRYAFLQRGIPILIYVSRLSSPLLMTIMTNSRHGYRKRRKRGGDIARLGKQGQAQGRLDILHGGWGGCWEGKDTRQKQKQGNGWIGWEVDAGADGNGTGIIHCCLAALVLEWPEWMEFNSCFDSWRFGSVGGLLAVSWVVFVIGFCLFFIFIFS